MLINYDKGLERFSNSISLYKKFLTMFCLDKNVEGLRKLVAIGNLVDYSEDIYAINHTLKGVVGNLSLDQLYAECVELQDLIKSENYTNAILLEKCNRFLVVYEQTIIEIKKYI